MSVELVAVAKEKFTSAESKLLNEITRSESIEVAISSDITTEDWRSTVDVVGRAYLRAQIQEAKLFPVLGRLLVIAESRPEIWEGFGSFKQFIHQKICPKFWISPSSAYEAQQQGRRLGHLELSQLGAIPRRNLRLVLQAVPKGDEKKSVATGLLAKATTMSEAELREFCEKKGYIGPGETQGAFLRVPCNKGELKFINKFLNNADFQSYCGTNKASAMIVRAIEEAITEWSAQAEEASKVIEAATAEGSTEAA